MGAWRNRGEARARPVVCEGGRPCGMHLNGIEEGGRAVSRLEAARSPRYAGGRQRAVGRTTESVLKEKRAGTVRIAMAFKEDALARVRRVGVVRRRLE